MLNSDQSMDGPFDMVQMSLNSWQHPPKKVSFFFFISVIFIKMVNDFPPSYFQVVGEWSDFTLVTELQNVFKSSLVGRKPTLGLPAYFVSNVRHVQLAILQTGNEGSIIIQVRTFFWSATFSWLIIYTKKFLHSDWLRAVKFFFSKQCREELIQCKKRKQTEHSDWSNDQRNSQMANQIFCFQIKCTPWMVQLMA